MVSFVANVLILAVIASIVAVGLDVMIGFTGIFSAAQAAFYGVGAYTAALLSSHLHNSVLAVLVVAAALAVVAGWLLAVPALRVKDEYFIIASVGFQYIVYAVFTNWQAVTGGMGGITGIPQPEVFGFQISSTAGFLALSVVLLACVLAATWALVVRSPLGRGLKALRDNEQAVLALGKNTVGLRIWAISIGCAWAAIGGVLYAYYVTFINPESFTVDQSVIFMTMVVFGGVGTLVGPVAGALFVTIFPSLLNLLGLPSQWMGPLQEIIYGLALIVLMIYRPEGLLGAWRALRRLLRGGPYEGAGRASRDAEVRDVAP
jgi:branched-chain amino acid transport system permease protein